MRASIADVSVAVVILSRLSVKLSQESDVEGLQKVKIATAYSRLDEELKRSATEASIVRLKIREEDLVDIKLSYNIPDSVKLRALGPEERANDHPEGSVSIYEPTMQQGLRLPMHPFFYKFLRDWNLVPCQIIMNGWRQMITAFLLWRVFEVGRYIYPEEFESIYRLCQSVSWYNISLCPGQKWRTAMDSPNKVHNWKDRFFFAGGGWKFLPEDPRPDVSIPRQFGDLNYRKPPIPKRNQEGLSMKWEKVHTIHALDSDSRSLKNLLKDDDLLICFGLMAFKFKGIPSFQLGRGRRKTSSQARVSSQRVSSP
ncbi:Plus3 domain-containing protein [Abeliophyllum distichum]|uniref:Plus3 domain-containing protein n=1 Tax=Abeliophyllum distichum TaxID=126358 RepID=A0ABD1UQ67_9LAMI